MSVLCTGSNSSQMEGSSTMTELTPVGPGCSGVNNSVDINHVLYGLDDFYPPSGASNTAVSEEGDEEYYEYYYQMKDCHEEVLNSIEKQLNDKDDEQNVREREVLELIEKLSEEDEELKRAEAQKKQLSHERKELKRMRVALAEANKSKQVFCCFICSRAFADEESIRQHVSTEHLKNDKNFIYKCSFCYMRFKKGQHLRRHEATHRRSKHGYFSCDRCPASYKEEASLEVHMSRTHSVDLNGSPIEKVLMCKCGQSFGLEIELQRHSWYCGNKKDIVEKRKTARDKIVLAGSPTVSPAFSVTSSIQSPALGRPTKDKSCPFCGDVFASMQSRTRHIGRKHPESKNSDLAVNHTYMKVDSPDLPFGCAICQKKFATQTAVNLHKRRIHEKSNQFQCDICEKAYPLQSELRKHVKRVHIQRNELSPVDEF